MKSARAEAFFYSNQENDSHKFFFYVNVANSVCHLAV